MIPASVVNYCKKLGIRHEMESPTEAHFLAPEGYAFSTESTARVIEIGDYFGGRPQRVMAAKEIKFHLTLYPKT